jgi:hypothetical protein
MDEEMIEEINKYYILKKKYEDTVTKEKKNILKNDSLSTADKRIRLKEMSFKCINCKKKGGTIFTNDNNILKAVCGTSTPCDLAIEINKGKILQLREILDMDSNYIDGLKADIISVKLNYLFKFIDQSEALIAFDTITQQLSDRAIFQQTFIKKYNDIVDNKNKESQLKTYISKLNLEIDNIKKLNKLYQSDKKDSILQTILENYTGLIQPLLDEIRELKYSYLTIEVDEKQNMNYFIAEPYTISQIEYKFKL